MMDERVAMTQASQQACDDDATGQCGGREESRSEEQGEGEVGEEGEEEDEEVDEDSEEEEMVPVLEHVEIRESMHGGLGLFALKHFTTGDVVVRESPYLAIKHLPWEDVEARLDHASESSRMIREAVEGLDAQNAALFWSFTQTDLYGDLKTPQGVFWTNMIELYKDVAEDEDNEGVSCMFEVTSRLNHACVPSVEWISYADIPMLDSVALRDIKLGEEIFVSYKTGDHSETLERREYLQKWYGFKCACRHCSAYLSRYNIPM